ncbi:MAG: PQQ-dependent sugar dehydrogenase [Proteobacteria bacterium]|nr:PQQ-dependent sugar dehydrogenase [Pseudomonadota bacterium]
MRTAIFLSFALLACNGSGTPDDVTDEGTDSNATGACSTTPVSGVGIQIETVATGVSVPTDITHAGDGSGRLFVTTQEGEILYFDGERNRFTFMDIKSRVGFGAGSERGLFAVAFHPNFATNNKFYVHYSDTSGDTVVSEFTASGNTGDTSSERILLQATQPAGNHNGGRVAFGPDGYLYIGLGDGGGGGDTYNNGQNQDTFLAKMLRIDVDGNNSSNGQYGIPADNPFIGVENHRSETWAWGLRNPWKFSWDRETGTMWIADVGQNAWEEIDIGKAGGNYGWSEAEGNHCFGGSCDLNLYEAPIYEYPHSVGISIVGGFVYRGCAMPDLAGNYFFSDTPWSGNSPLWSITWDGTNNAVQGAVWMDQISGRVTTLGEDEEGEIYIGEYTSGQIYKIVPSGT